MLSLISKNLIFHRLFAKEKLSKFLSTIQTSKESDLPPYVKPSSYDGAGKLVFFKIHGCQMNFSDAEIVWSVLKSNNYCKTSDLSCADFILYMTCALRESAESKIWQSIGYIEFLKKGKKFFKNPNIKIGVLGCMAERLKGKIFENCKSVSLIAGPDSYRDLPRMMKVAMKHHYDADDEQEAVNVDLSMDETYADILPVRIDESTKTAFVSIMRGCNNMCSYCIVPFTRGRERSRPITSIFKEILNLESQGIKEITLLGQNVNSYCDSSPESSAEMQNLLPSDLWKRGEQRQILSNHFSSVNKRLNVGILFQTLLDVLAKRFREIRFRFTSPHPKDFPDDLLDVISANYNICKQLHLPAQSGSSDVLQRMNRGYTREAYLQLIQRVREKLPNVYLTSDFIAGFCGESECDHEETLSLLRTVRYSFVYFYPYSMRAKTRAHHRLTDDVPTDVKCRRAEEIKKTFREITKTDYSHLIGSEQLVLVQGRSKKKEEDLVGKCDAGIKVNFPCSPLPDLDESGVHRVPRPGDYVIVEISSSSSQTLYASPLSMTSLQRYHSWSIQDQADLRL